MTGLLAAGWTSRTPAGEAAPRARFLADLQRAVRDDDTAWLAAHMRFPLKVRGRRIVVVGTREAFVQRQHALIGPKLRIAVLAQRPDDLFSGWQGMMIGTGERNLWVYEDIADPARPTYRIVGITGTD